MLVVSLVRQLQPLWWWLWWGLMEGIVVSSNGAKRESEATQSRLTLCDSMAYSLPGLSIHGIFQAKVLEWVAISFSNAWKWKVRAKSLSRVQLLANPWTAAHQAPPSMGSSRQEYWSGLPSPSPGELPHPGIEPRFPALQADALPSEPPGKLLAFG